MTTEQIYQIVNDTASQAMGSTALTVVDVQGLISLGNAVLDSSVNTEAFLNTLAQRIGRTIYRYREYSNKFKDMMVSDMEWGAILQKIRVSMPAAVQDDAYNLVDGSSIDPFIVHKPQANQKLFVTRTPYCFEITIQRETLKEAFTSESAMGSFISLVFGEVRNAIEFSLENLGRLTLAEAICETGASQQVKLLTDYAADTGISLTPATAVYDADFLRYAIYRINNVIDMMQDMSTQYNDGSFPTFTNKENMRIKVLSSFERRLQTVVQYAAFHDQFVGIDGSYTTLNFWQSEQSPDGIILDRASDGTTTAFDHVIAVVHDRDAFGIYQIDEVVMTSPVNQRGLYYNQAWHEKQGRFCDTSENLVIFELD